MQHISHVLVAKTTVDHEAKLVVFVGPFQQFLPFPRGGQHIGGDHIGQGVVVYVGNINAHRVARLVGKGFFGRFNKVAFLVIDIEIVLLFIIVGYIQIWPAIAGQITHSHPQPEIDTAPVDARLFRHVGEMAVGSGNRQASHWGIFWQSLPVAIAH